MVVTETSAGNRPLLLTQSMCCCESNSKSEISSFQKHPVEMWCGVSTVTTASSHLWNKSRPRPKQERGWCHWLGQSTVHLMRRFSPTALSLSTSPCLNWTQSQHSALNPQNCCPPSPASLVWSPNLFISQYAMQVPSFAPPLPTH